MILLFAFLTVAFIVMLIIGLIKPSTAIFWGTNKSRSKVVLVYGVAAITSFIILMIVTPTNEKVVPKEFTGEIVYEAVVSGDSTIARNLADMGISQRTIIQIGKNSFQCTEVGGLTDGTFLKDTAKYKSWFLDHDKKIAIHGTCSDIDENVNDALKLILPYPITIKPNLRKPKKHRLLWDIIQRSIKCLNRRMLRITLLLTFGLPKN